MSILGYARPPGARGIQIGPRIRVGGTLGKIGQNVKVGLGKVAENPITQGIVGATLGPGAAAGVAGLGKVLDTTGGGIHGVGGIADLGVDALKGYGIGKLGQVVRGAAGKIGDVLGSDQSIGGKIHDIATGVLPGAVKGAISDIPGVSSIENYLGGGDNGGNGPNWGQLGLLGLGGAQLANAIALGKKSSDYANQAMSGMQQNYDDRSRLRVAGIQGMLNPQTPDLSGLLTNSGPYAAGLPRPMPVSQYTGLESVPSRTGTVSGK